jgi:HAE1 family hydrophobic/amphiphilic exporter-1
MDAILRAVEAEINQVGGVTHVLATIGSSGMARVNMATIYVRIEDIEKRVFSFGRLVRETLAGRPLAAFQGNYSQREKMQQIRARLAKYPDLRISVRNQTSLRQGAPVDIDFAITGPDLEQLARYSEALRKKISPGRDGKPAELPGFVDADITLRLNKPQLLAGINRPRAAALGVDVQEIADTLRVAVGGDDRVSRYLDPQLDEVYDVELRLVGIDRATPEAISQLYVRAKPSAVRDAGAATEGDQRAAPRESLTRLDNVVTFRRNERSAARIDRLDRQRMCSVRANVAPGYALGDCVETLRRAAEDLGMPAAYSTRILGSGRELERTLRDFQWTFVLSFIFMYIILAAQFEHFIHPLTILFSLPLAVPFGLVSLWLGGESLNLYSAVGILVLFGLIKKASILQVDMTNQLRARGLDRRTAILQANRDRLRPILMTTVAFVAGMLPLLLGTGPGAEERRSIAVLAVGGQTLSLLLTLVAVPVVYTFLDDLGMLLSRKQSPARADGKRPEVPAPVLQRIEPAMASNASL